MYACGCYVRACVHACVCVRVCIHVCVCVCVCYSGTVVGILLDARQRRSKPAFRRAQQEFADAASVRHFRVIGGGVRQPPEPGAG